MDLYTKDQIEVIELKQQIQALKAKHSLQVVKLVSLQYRFVEQLFIAFEATANHEETNFGNKKYTPTTKLKWHIKTLRTNAMNQLREAQNDSTKQAGV